MSVTQGTGIKRPWGGDIGRPIRETDRPEPIKVPAPQPEPVKVPA
jgi:hypothetical protein